MQVSMSRLSSDENIFKGDFYEAEQEADMHAFGAEDEDYYFQIAENLEDDRQFILIIYDIVDKSKIWETPTTRKRCFLWQQSDLSKVLDQLLNFVLR